jgi:membrane protein DedA with SNARE-associated domain
MAAENKGKKKQPRILTLSGIALQMGITIYLGAHLGKYLDKEYAAPDSRLWTILCTLAAVALSFYNLLKRVNKLNGKDD